MIARIVNALLVHKSIRMHETAAAIGVEKAYVGSAHLEDMEELGLPVRPIYHYEKMGEATRRVRDYRELKPLLELLAGSS